MFRESINKALKWGLLSGTIAFVLLILLQPFGIDRVEGNKILLVSGYAIISIFWVTVAHILCIALGWENLNFTDWRFAVQQVFIVLFLGISISCYASWYFTGTIKYSIFNNNGDIDITSIGINCIYAIIISIFINIFIFMKERNKTIKRQLEEEREMNKRIMQQLETSARQETPEVALDPITITGATKESLTIVPSNIIYAVSDSNYIDIVYINSDNTAARKTLRLTMKQIEETLAPYSDIVRCHRAYIVNIKHVIHVDGNSQGYKLKLNMTDDIVPVSRAYASAIYEQITGEK